MKIITFPNDKGGTGKTTSAVNVADYLARQGYQVLLVDVDQQHHATQLFLPQPKYTWYHAFTVPDIVSPDECLYQVREDRALWLLPAATSLVDVESVLSTHRDLQGLSRIVQGIGRKFDYVILDAPPARDMLLLNALYLADDVIIPVETSQFAYNGAASMLDLCGQMQCNIVGLLPTLYHAGQNADRVVLEALQAHYPKLVLPPIRKNADLKTAQVLGQTIFEFAPRSSGAVDYARLGALYG